MVSTLFLVLKSTVLRVFRFISMAFYSKVNNFSVKESSKIGQFHLVSKSTKRTR
jgi:hypothetical protein